ncbi:acyl-[acyl-carrier-protein]--UDP-N-acetylglucosam O-acyltransferase [Deferribacter desulfuricans SSM1]|uniref:Acyl-[acyl-carrier-protein]--UDP-N-acetylglucosam O-acyltransferase n=1 Tax=Deferribacter desulfuricans (strain DSM 14783 / JCM 11476 / NBRC 101012 / SSM1) TaxID=639282 RepID=D3PAJ7_DEFDS|nr:acyl-ACP--UDP-N-acetylglucosamine O-acyltransferase [Deferribacter desulfuricans]BAI79620.1 acyl-[acyl-carrier-protein]--UDP-N-acetylglucosam O-acyltransferase [Deferribacter desulfuricans SSM1]
MIHKTAVIDKSSEVSSKADIGPNVFIGKNCIIHDNVKIGFGAVIEENTEIKEGTVISPNAHLGGAPQDISYKGEDTKLIVGKNCVIREFVTIHRASTKEDWTTVVGDNCFIMANSHIAHDCKLGNNIILTSYSGLAGHIHVGDMAVISGFVAVHQFVRIGKMAMIGGMSRITMDVPPFTLVEGSPAVIHGLNVVGLRRRGVSSDVRNELKRLLKIFLDKSLTKNEALNEMSQLVKSDEGLEFVEFLKESKRGVIRR